MYNKLGTESKTQYSLIYTQKLGKVNAQEQESDIVRGRGVYVGNKETLVKGNDFTFIRQIHLKDLIYDIMTIGNACEMHTCDTGTDNKYSHHSFTKVYIQ